MRALGLFGLAAATLMAGAMESSSFFFELRLGTNAPNHRKAGSRAHRNWRKRRASGRS